MLRKWPLLMTLAVSVTLAGCGFGGGTAPNGTNESGPSSPDKTISNSESPAQPPNNDTQPAPQPPNNSVSPMPPASNSDHNQSPNPNPDPSPAPNPSPAPKPGPSPSTSLSTKTLSWWYTPNSMHKTPVIPSDIKSMIAKYHGYYVGQTSKKVLYLTFDEGYENGNTAIILDELKAAHVHASFFVTASYIRKNPKLIERMVAEGHVVGNHSSTHPDMSKLVNKPEEFSFEFTDTEKAYQNVTLKPMPKLFRPPSGEYSEKMLFLTNQLGYKTFFWSFAYRDWLTDNQPPVSTARKQILTGVHNGGIVLLHAVSSSNTKALPGVLTTLKQDGYRFQTLDKL